MKSAKLFHYAWLPVLKGEFQQRVRMLPMQAGRSLPIEEFHQYAMTIVNITERAYQKRSPFSNNMLQERLQELSEDGRHPRGQA